MRRYPAWSPASGGGWRKGADYMTEAGAYRLAGMIRDAWARVGVDLRVEVVPPQNVHGPWLVRMPDLVRGVPV